MKDRNVASRSTFVIDRDGLLFLGVLERIGALPVQQGLRQATPRHRS